MASQRNTSLFQGSVRCKHVSITCTYGNAPISDIDNVVPLFLDAFVQKAFKPRDPCFTKPRPHLFWFDICVAIFPLVLD